MFDIILSQIGTEKVNAVSARELHTKLHVGKDFSNWIKGRISKYDFVENEDFVTHQSPLAKFGELELPGLQGRVDYFITLDMAKELSMVENNKFGRDARRYFIECEKKLKEAQYGLKQLPPEPQATKIHYFDGVEVRQQGDWFWISKLCQHFYKFPADFLKQKRFKETHQANPPARVSHKGTWISKGALLELCFWLSPECGEWADSILHGKKEKTITLTEYLTIIHPKVLEAFGVGKTEVQTQTLLGLAM